MRIRDPDLMDKFSEDFKELSKRIPALQSFDDVWGIYDREGKPIHVSLKEEKKYMPLIEKVLDANL